MKRRYIILLLLVFSFPFTVYGKDKIKVKLDKCVDGDTAIFIVDGESKKTRFLGVNTPESVKENSPVEPYGKEASKYTCNRLKKAKKIEIQYDPKSDKEDNYGRLLGWIFVDDKLLQKDLVRLGYAEVKYVYDKYLYVDELKELEKKAKDKKIKIWSEEAELNREYIKDHPDEEVDSFTAITQKITNFFSKIIRNVVKKVKSVL